MIWNYDGFYWRAAAGAMKVVVYLSRDTGGWVYCVNDHSKGRWAPTQGERVAAGGPYKTAGIARRYCREALNKLSPG